MPGPSRGRQKALKASKTAMKAALRRSVRANIRQYNKQTPEQQVASGQKFLHDLNASPDKDKLIALFSSKRFKKVARQENKFSRNQAINTARRESDKVYKDKYIDTNVKYTPHKGRLPTTIRQARKQSAAAPKNRKNKKNKKNEQAGYFHDDGGYFNFDGSPKRAR